MIDLNLTFQNKQTKHFLTLLQLSQKFSCVKGKEQKWEGAPEEKGAGFIYENTRTKQRNKGLTLMCIKQLVWPKKSLRGDIWLVDQNSFSEKKCVNVIPFCSSETPM